MVYETLHWDGGSLLFTTNSAGALDDIKIGGLANFVISSGTVKVAFNDRDFSGAIASSHTSAGAGTWYPPNPNRQLCSSAGTNDPITQPGPDGITDGINIFQGARAYDPVLGNWTAPDAYAGNVGDPMSQKAYMWDGNNSFLYTDPSGYVATVIVSGNNVTILLPIEYTGSATHAQRVQYNASIQQHWSGHFGKYSVTARVVAPTAGKVFNTVNTSEPAGFRDVTNKIGGNHVDMTTHDADAAWAIAHEAGHLMGLGDKYNPFTGRPLPGYGDDIMGVRDQNGVKPNQIQQIINVNPEATHAY